MSRQSLTAVPFPTSEVTVIVWESFVSIFLQRKSPIPVDFLSSLPLNPVKPFSKIRGKSSGLIPIPFSEMTSQAFSQYFHPIKY